MFDLIKQNEARSSYIYAPRFVAMAIRNDSDNFDSNMMNAIIMYYKDITKADPNKIYSDAECRLILQTYKQEIENERQQLKR